MPDEFTLSRRQLLVMSLALSGAAFAAPFDQAAQAESAVPSGKTPTPDQVMGPFYPVEKPVDKDADLTIIQGKSGKAKGQVIHLMGRVLNLKGEPMRDVQIEIWQANTFGRYAHPSDSNPAPLDPNFQGYGVVMTDSEGRYRFKTVKPGAYRVTADWTRPPHIHFDITGRSNKLVTQMYFEGEPLNSKDLLYKNTVNKEYLLTKLMPPMKDVEPDSQMAVWDIVLAQV